ncbi:hypothetical protein ACKKBG_A17625 [Auxenochlorella protothecoides x Auxenochlorella symbiontica]
MTAISLKTAAVTAMLVLTQVDAHGYIAVPASRNFLHNTDYCPHCLNAGGTRATSEGGALRWPLSRHGICGDPFAGERKHEYGGVSATGTITGNYTEGDNINITIVINTSHKGRFSFRICVIWNPSLELTELTEDCLNEHILVQADVPGAQNPGTAHWYDTGSDATMTYKLPQGLTCDGQTTRCVLQWYYLTGNTCDPPNTDPSYASLWLPGCLDDGASYPEEFWNCADISIAPASSETSSSTSSPTSLSPSPVSQWSTPSPSSDSSSPSPKDDSPSPCLSNDSPSPSPSDTSSSTSPSEVSPSPSPGIIPPSHSPGNA